MKSDVNGCSTVKAGEEKYKTFNTKRGERVQYDYRALDGDLFSCVAKTLEAARLRRDEWIVKRNKG